MTLPIIRHLDGWERIKLNPLADGSGFAVLETLRCQYDIEDGTTYFLTVPVDFRTDLASIPALVRPMFKSFGWWTRASIYHDLAYHYGAGEKSDSDSLFEVILTMDQPDPPPLGREDDIVALTSAVRVFGRGNFDNPSPDAKKVLSKKGYSHAV